MLNNIQQFSTVQYGTYYALVSLGECNIAVIRTAYNGMHTYNRKPVKTGHLLTDYRVHRA